jgi:hypothetical protein
MVENFDSEQNIRTAEVFEQRGCLVPGCKIFGCHIGYFVDVGRSFQILKKLITEPKL